VRRADNLTTFIRRLSRNLGASYPWKPKGLSRPVMGLLKSETCHIEIISLQQHRNNVDACLFEFYFSEC
jgi:hypothetical protein